MSANNYGSDKVQPLTMERGHTQSAHVPLTSSVVGVAKEHISVCSG